jgi:hypothetical protein
VCVYTSYTHFVSFGGTPHSSVRSGGGQIVRGLFSSLNTMIHSSHV